MFTPSFFLSAFLAALILVVAPIHAQQRADQEITYPGEDFAKLDTFESLNLEDADKLFSQKKDYKGAYAAYRAYSFEFTQSAALPYVLLRMGRCLHLLEKRNAAIKAYQDVIDYFPDDIVYAAAALYFIGECHGQNGDEAKKTATWARMVKDDAYVAQPRSGTALSYLGAAMAELGNFEEAVEYQWRTATAFLAANPKAAEQARRSVIQHYVERSPNHEKLKKFYTAASGFDGRGQKVENPEEDTRYWSSVLDAALRVKEAEQKSGVCGYWTSKMGDRFEDDDSLRKKWIDAIAAHEKDFDSWKARMEKQFAHQPKDIQRVLQWCDYYQGNRELQSEFFAKQGQPLVASTKDFEERMRVLDRLRSLRMNEEILSAIRTTSTSGLEDAQLARLGGFVAHYDAEDAVLSYFAKMKDKTDAAKARFDYFHGRSHRNPPYMEKALAEIPALEKSPKYSSADLTVKEARLLQGLGQYEAAIKAYREANVQPDSTRGVAECQVGMKQYSQAVKTLQDLYAVGGDVASSAALRVADIYKIAGDKGREVTQLRMILKNYGKSSQSSEAHNRLESYGVALVGGEAEAEE